jgi:putative SOS response-associated peptidase YedK
MLVILNKEDYGLWLSPNEEPAPVLQALMKPYDGKNLAAYAVSKLVNRPSNETPELIQAVD